MNLFENLQKMTESDEKDSQVTTMINEILDSFKSIKENIITYQSAMGTIKDAKGYDFSYKLYKLANDLTDEAEDYDDYNFQFELRADDIYNEWVAACEKAFNCDYKEIFKPDNHNGSYFSFNEYYIYIALLANNLSEPYKNVDIFLLLNDEDKIGPYYDDYVINSLETDNEINVDMLKEEDPDYYTDIISDIHRDMTDIAKQVQDETNEVVKLVDLYHELKGE